jgi:hypothetical protein
MIGCQLVFPVWVGKVPERETRVNTEDAEEGRMSQSALRAPGVRRERNPRGRSKLRPYKEERGRYGGICYATAHENGILD